MLETQQHFKQIENRFNETMNKFRKQFDLFGNLSLTKDNLFDKELNDFKFDDMLDELKLTKKQSSDIFDKLE